MKASDVRVKTQDQLNDELASLKKEQFNLRFQKATGQVEKTHRVGEVRKDIARIKTVLRTKRYLAHDEANACKVGDRVSIIETRPISKRKSWLVLSEAEASAIGASADPAVSGA